MLSSAKTVCPSDRVHKDCGPVEPPTCLTIFKPITSLSTVSHCNDDCYCPDGLVQDGDNCVRQETCGCFYNDEYFEVNIPLQHLSPGGMVLYGDTHGHFILKYMDSNDTKIIQYL